MINTYTTYSHANSGTATDYLYRIIMDDMGRTITISHEAENIMRENNIEITEEGIMQGLFSFLDHKPIEIDLFSSSTNGKNDVHISMDTDDQVVIKFIDSNGIIYRKKMLDINSKTITISNHQIFKNFYEQLNQALNE